MTVVIRYAGLAGTVDDPTSSASLGDYLENYDPEAYEGRGYAKFTSNPSRAMHFPDMAAARRCILQVPVKRPRRPDGKANMPLRAFHLEIERITDDERAN
jgi:hypothetical protein